MNTPSIVLDHIQGIALDPSNPPFNNYQVFHQSYIGLKILADTVREFELKVIAEDPHAAYTVLRQSSSVPPIIPCSFNWFSITIVSYLRLIALVDLMAKNNWKANALAESDNRQTIKDHCTEYVREAVPEIYLWRNKVAAHFAATDPFRDDTLGTLEQSIMNPVSYQYPFYYVGMFQWHIQNTSANLPTWSLTNTYEQLRTRYWPEMKLKSLPESSV